MLPTTTTPDWFRKAVSSVHALFESDDELPLIDAREYIDQDVVLECWRSTAVVGSGTVSRDVLIESALTGNHENLSERFVWLNLFYMLATLQAEVIFDDLDMPQKAPTLRASFLADLRSFVGLPLVEKQVLDCRDVRRIRWEITNACAAKDWGLAGRYYGRLEQIVEPAARPAVLASRGRQEFLAVFLPRWADFEDIGPSLLRPFGTDVRYNVSPVLALKALDMAVDLNDRLSGEEETRTMEAARYLTKALDAGMRPDLEFRCMLLRCRVALGQFMEAADECKKLLLRREEFNSGSWADSGLGPLFIPRLLELAVEAYAAAGEIEQSIVESDRWLEEFPDEQDGTRAYSARIYERRSRLFQLQGDLDSAYQSLREAVERNPVKGEDPNISMALRFGGLYASPDVQWKRFVRSLDPDFASRVEKLVMAHWPNAQKLPASHLKEWVAGCSLLLRRDPDMPAMAGLAFGRIAEAQIQLNVFDRFCETVRAKRASFEGEDPLTKFVRENKAMSLEQKLNELKYRKGRSQAASEFRGWLDRNPLQVNVEILEPLGNLNNLVKHIQEDILDWDGAGKLAGLAREVVDAIYSKPSRSGGATPGLPSRRQPTPSSPIRPQP